jgi:hypothetical protein
MDKARLGRLRWLALLPLCGCLGCLTFNPGAAPQIGQPDPFVETIAKQPVLGKVDQTAVLKPDIVLEEVPLHTPVAQARAIMEQHGFSCWARVPDNNRECLHCTAYLYQRGGSADRIVVKLIYEKQQIVKAEVVVDYDVRHSEHGFWPVFSGP